MTISCLHCIIIWTSRKETRRIICIYLPLKTNALRLQKYKEMQIEVLKCLDYMVYIEKWKYCRWARGHSMKTMKSQCLRNIQKYNFPHGTVGIWNDLSKEVFTADNLYIFKEIFNKYRYGDKTLRFLFKPRYIHLHKYN